MTGATDSVPALLQAVQAGDDVGAEEAVLGLRSDDEERLLAWVRSAEGDLRWWAIRGLGACGTPQSVPTLTQALAQADVTLQTVVVWSLAHIERRFPGQHDVLTTLVQLLGAPDGWVRQTAADALALCGEAAVPVLGEAMASKEESIRVRSTYALAKMASLQGAPYLFQALHDRSPLVRTLAYDALDAMGLLENVLISRA